jgi:antitoxin (DNA-binding transcriptional repressor) of toxin-antitoxin stability system
MNASIVDLRYKMSEVLSALERREQVTILYHGKVKGTIVPSDRNIPLSVKEHPFFGMMAEDAQPVAQVMHELRGGRFNDL